MRNKSLFLLIAGVCGTIAAVGVGQWMQALPSNTAETVEILVTTQAINAEEEITADKLRLEQWPADRIPNGSSADLSIFEGRFAKVPLFEGEPMLDQKLMNEVEDMVVPKGYTVVSLPAKDGTGNLMKPGDRVDIRGFFAKGEMFARDTALDVLTGVKVYGIDGITKFDPEERRGRSARDIQLLIRKADQQAFDFAKKLGEVSLSLGSPTADDDTIPVDEPSSSAKQFLQDLDDYREEQERLRLEEEEKARQQQVPDAPEEVEQGPKKETFRITKMVNGRLTVYEFTEGDPVPKIIADTGALELGNHGESESSTDNASTGSSQSDDYLRGDDSPFFAPGEESGETEDE